MAEICGILSLKLNVVCQLEEHLKLVTCDFMDTLSEKGYSVNCALRSVDQGNGLLTQDNDNMLKPLRTISRQIN